MKVSQTALSLISDWQCRRIPIIFDFASAPINMRSAHLSFLAWAVIAPAAFSAPSSTSYVLCYVKLFGAIDPTIQKRISKSFNPRTFR
jgi:hypothetical protein